MKPNRRFVKTTTTKSRRSNGSKPLGAVLAAAIAVASTLSACTPVNAEGQHRTDAGAPSESRLQPLPDPATWTATNRGYEWRAPMGSVFHSLDTYSWVDFNGTEISFRPTGVVAIIRDWGASVVEYPIVRKDGQVYRDTSRAVVWPAEPETARARKRQAAEQARPRPAQAGAATHAPLQQPVGQQPARGQSTDVRTMLEAEFGLDSDGLDQ